MAEAELMGRNEYARHRGCAPNAVKKAEDDGRIAAAVQRGEDGTFIGIDWRLADELWARNTDPVEAARNGKVNELPAQAAPLAAGAPLEISERAKNGDSPSSDEKDGGYYEARAKRERFAALTAEREYLEAIGQLVWADDVREVAARRYRAIRDKLLNIADRVSSILAAEKEPARIHAALTTEIKRVLNELSDDAHAEAAGGAEERVAA